MGWPAFFSGLGQPGFPASLGRAGRPVSSPFPFPFLPRSSPAAAARHALLPPVRPPTPPALPSPALPSPPTHRRPVLPFRHVLMEVYDDDGTPALPFAVPPPVPVQYDLPPEMLCKDNLVLSRTYDKMGVAVNGILARIYKEPKIYVPPSEDAKTKGLIDEVLRVSLKVSRFIEQMQENGGVAFIMPPELEAAIEFIRPLGTV